MRRKSPRMARKRLMRQLRSYPRWPRNCARSFRNLITDPMAPIGRRYALINSRTGFSLSSFEFCRRDRNQKRLAKEAAEKVSYFVIPNEVRNLSGFKSQETERFLGTRRA